MRSALPPYVCVLAAALVLVPVGHSQTLKRASLDPIGGEANGASSHARLSHDARFVAFQSIASDLVAGDTNGSNDIFVHDRLSGTTSCASIDRTGRTGNGHSFAPALSADGRFVAFHSDASTLVASDTNGLRDVFVRDLQAGVTVLASVDSSGMLSDNLSMFPTISGDGRFVAFHSYASNLVPGISNGLTQDVFVRDIRNGTTFRVSVDSAGVEGNSHSTSASISGDGSLVAFLSLANNLVSNDTNGMYDVFVHDLRTGRTERVNLSTAGAEANRASVSPFLSYDGRTLAFESNATNLVPGDTNNQGDIFVRTLTSSTIERVSVASNGSQALAFCRTPALSSDGRFVCFHSPAPNLVPNDRNSRYDVFVRDRMNGTTTRVSTDPAGIEGDGTSLRGSFDASGRYVCFESLATNLVQGDLNGQRDVFVRDRITLELVGIPATHQPVHFGVREALGETGNPVLVFLSCSGNAGFPLGNRIVPLSFDTCTSGGLALLTLLSATIDATGSANTPCFPFPPAIAGVPIHAAAVSFDPTLGRTSSFTGPIRFVTG